jgi:sugar lactone lactonase YvrE
MLYVASSHKFAGFVSVYPLGQNKPVMRLTAGLDYPSKIEVDADGNVYVANDLTICEFAPGSKHRIRTLDVGIGTHGDFAFDVHGNVYVGYYFGREAGVYVYAPGRRHFKHVITEGVTAPVALALDPKGNLYVANAGNPSTVNVYAADKTSPTRSLSGELVNVQALAFDSVGNLYVADQGNQEYGIRSNTAKVLVYAPGSSKPSRSIRTGNLGPVALKFDSLGNLYVGNVFVNKKPKARGYVSVYAPGASKPSYQIGRLDSYEVLLGLDAQNNLYVGHQETQGRVFVYPQDSSKPNLRITAGIIELQGLGVSPQ